MVHHHQCIKHCSPRIVAAKTTSYTAMLADVLESEERLELDSEEEEERQKEKEQDLEEEQDEVQEQEKELEQNWMVDWEEHQFGSAVWDSVEIEKELD